MYALFSCVQLLFSILRPGCVFLEWGELFSCYIVSSRGFVMDIYSDSSTENQKLSRNYHRYKNNYVAKIRVTVGEEREREREREAVHNEIHKSLTDRQDRARIKFQWHNDTI